MKRVLITTGKSVSLKSVCRTIGAVLQRHGIQPILEHVFRLDHIRSGFVDGVLFDYPADMIYANEYAGYYILIKPMLGDKCLWYTTVEGKPDPFLARKPLWQHIEFIANSQFTASMLTQAGLKVAAVVPHGVDKGLLERANALVPAVRKRIENQFPDKVVFGVVSDDNIRKNMDGLVQAVQILNSKGRKDFVVLIMTKTSNPEKFSVPNIYVVDYKFERSQEEAVAMMGACDWTIYPSQCEGFGLPVLESMAMGTPVVHCFFPPLTEFSEPNGNIVFPYEFVEEVESKGGMIFTLHRYRPDALAEAMEEAIDIAKNKKEEMKERSARVKEKAKEYDADKVYKYFVDIYLK